MSKLTDDILEAIRSGNGGLWVKTQEIDEAVREIAALNTDEEAAAAAHLWSCVDGVSLGNEVQQQTVGLAEGPPPPDYSELTELNSALDWFLHTATAAGDSGDEDLTNGKRQLLVLRNGHSVFESSVEGPTALTLYQRCIEVGRATRFHVIVLAHNSVDVPAELQEVFWPIEHELPHVEDRRELISSLATDSEIILEDEKANRLADMTGGLTRNQVANICALSILRKNTIDEDLIAEEKTRLINQGGLLELSQVRLDFKSIGGMEGMKSFCRDILKPRTDGVRPKGILLLGVGGCGKTAGARALGNELGRPTLELDPGRLMGGLVGQSEGNTRLALATADAIEPAILYVDELERTMPNQGSGGDGGVGTRVLGNMMTWLNDHTSDVFFIASANDVRPLPSQFTRAERFDAVFFVDLPTKEVREEIWKIHRKMQEIDDEQPNPKDDNWSGAEIAACCRIARLRNKSLVEVAKSIVPIYETGKEAIWELREWADGRVLCAETGEIYKKPARVARRPTNGVKAKATRKVGT